MFQMVSTATLTLIVGAINQAIKKDELTQRKLARLEGKVVCRRLNTPKLDFFIQIISDGVRVPISIEHEPDLTISGTPSDFLQIVLAEDMNSALFGSQVRIGGNEHLAQTLMTLTKELTIDWEYLLSKVTGDVIAHQIGQGVKLSSGWFKQTNQSMIDNLEEYIHHELRTLPHASEIDYYSEQVSELRLQTDRLNAKIKQLEDKASSNTQELQQGVRSDQP